MKPLKFDEFLHEDYFTGISKSTADKKKAQMAKQADMPDDDPNAYKEMPGDTKGEKNLKTSKHTKKYHDLYEKEEKQSTDKGPISDDAIETGLKNKSEDTGVPIGILRAVMRRGLAAWKSGHRPGAGQQQWGYARVNSFLTKGKGTWGKADADLAKEVRDGGHDKDLKESSICEYESLIEAEGRDTLSELNDMSLGQLERIADYANMIKDRMEKGEQLESWMYSQLTIALENLNSVHDAMDGNDGVIEK
jgi:hypothetical protein